MVLIGGGCGPDGPPGVDGGDAGDAAPDALADGALDAPSDGAADAPSDASLDGTTLDAAADASDAPDATDAATDSSLDASADASPSVCGDGVRTLTQECNDGVNDPRDLCSSLCETREQLPPRAPFDGGAPRLRALGTSRHPLAVGPQGFAVTWIEPQVPLDLGITFYGTKGLPTGVIDRFAVSSTVSPFSAPAVAALPNGKFVVVWSDLGGDGDGLGVVARIVDPNVASSGPPVRVNQATASSQADADVIWTGSEVVVAWTDLSVFPADVRYRTFDATLAPTSGELTLAATSAGEGTVSLAPFNGGFAAAWREIAGNVETVRVKLGGATFVTPGAAVGPYEYPPALVELDATHALLVYAEATGPSSSKIRGAVVDALALGTLVPFDLGALAQGDAGAPPTAFRPAAAKVGAKVFVSWTAEAIIADPKRDELWLKECGWNGTTLDVSAVEIPLPRWDNHRPGDQRFPALAPSTLAPGGALAVAWVDLGSTLTGSATTDVAVSLLPVPILRNVNADGGGL